LKGIYDFKRNIVLLEIKNIGSWAGMGEEQTDWFSVVYRGKSLMVHIVVGPT